MRLRRSLSKQLFLNLNLQTGFQKTKTTINVSLLSIWRPMKQMLISRPMVNIPSISPQLEWIATRWSKALWVHSSTKATSLTWNSFNSQMILLKTRCWWWNTVTFQTLYRSHRSPLRYQLLFNHLQAFWRPIDVPPKRGSTLNLWRRRISWRSKKSSETMKLKTGCSISGKSKTKWPFSKENSNNQKSFPTRKFPPFFN